jgi:hypothetical protein
MLGCELIIEDSTDTVKCRTATKQKAKTKNKNKQSKEKQNKTKKKQTTKRSSYSLIGTPGQHFLECLYWTRMN